MLALRKLLNKPKMEEGSLLSLFYFCDVAVNNQMDELNRLMRSTPDNLDRRSTLIQHLKEAQHNLMTVMMSIMEEAIPNCRASRDFRAKYPDDVLLEQISGPIWFGAECIAAGSHIANHELESTELRPYAIHISKTVSKVRRALREQCFINRAVYTQRLKDLLQVFDELWADFEFRYVGLMCNVKSEVQYLHQQDVVVLFCESTLRAVKLNYISYSMLETMEPSVMFAIPRLAIFCGLVIYPNGPLNPSQPQKDIPPFFRAYRQLLSRIKELLGYLDQDQLVTLERALCSAEGLGTLRRKANSKKRKTSKQPSSIPQIRNLQVSDPPDLELAEPSPTNTNPDPLLAVESAGHENPDIVNRSYNLDSRESTSTVFEPIPVDMTSQDNHQNKEEEETHSDVFVSEEPPFPQLGDHQPIVNDLPSDTSAPLPMAAVDDAHQLPCSEAAARLERGSSTKAVGKGGKRLSHKGPAGFPSAEDLMHRLFLGISGVADQLQMNHAKDLRGILKQVFTVCQSDDLDEESHCPEGLEDDGCVLERREPCSPGQQSPIITTSQRFSFTIANMTTDNQPSWVPDSDSPNCAGCVERFFWRRRRHHCRNCGKTVCSRCSRHSLPLPHYGIVKPVRVCTGCYISKLGEVSRQMAPLSQSMHV